MSQLLEVVQRLADEGASFKSLGDPIDTPGPSDRLVLQVLDAAGEFERQLIKERTKASIRHAKSQGRAG